MLDINFIRENASKVKEGVTAKGYDAKIVDKALELDKEYRNLLQSVEELRKERNVAARIKDEKRGRQIKAKLGKLEPDLRKTEKEFERILWSLPNLPHPKAPKGASEKENVVLKDAEPKKFDFKPKDHLELGKFLDIIDFETGAKVAGSQFYYLKNEGVLLELALTKYALDVLEKEGFTLWLTPDLARLRIIDGTGFNPKGPESQIYTISGHDLGLIATAEVTLAGIHSDEVLEEKNLPKLYSGFSHCFRVEAGGYGQYSRGLYRVHQFSKVEMFVYCRQEDSDKYQEKLLGIEEKLFQGLGIPYRIVEMCTGDLGAAAARKYDLEVWIPGRPPAGGWGEVTSTSNTTDYQARRLNIKYKKPDGGTDFVHTLNGTAIAISRALVAILENYQQKDGSVVIPDILRDWVGKDKITPH